jgi:hypothetical protein
MEAYVIGNYSCVDAEENVIKRTKVPIRGANKGIGVPPYRESVEGWILER